MYFYCFNPNRPAKGPPARGCPFSLSEKNLRGFGNPGGAGTDMNAGGIVILSENSCPGPMLPPLPFRHFIISQESILSEKSSDRLAGDAAFFWLRWLRRAAVPAMLAGTLLFIPVSVPDAHAATIAVNSTDDSDIPGDGKCSLRKAIVNANERPGTPPNGNPNTPYSDCAPGSGDDTIIIPAGTYTLTKELPLIIGNTVLEGAGIGTTVIDGANTYRIFFVGYTGKSPTVTFKNMTVQNAEAKGGDGGGGGAGLGAGLFMYSGSVTVDTVRFANNRAIGGSGGGYVYGGGGLGGIGNSGGGGFDISAFGGFDGNGGCGCVGGGGGFGGSDGGVGGYGAGGKGGGLAAGTSGGFGGGGGNGSTGGGGGFGGGGGYGNPGGSGGFGGGGSGGYYRGGDGGFGGGGGGYYTGSGGPGPGVGGFGGGDGSGVSGGGAGFGGAVFAQKGTMTFKNVSFNTNSSAGGAGGAGGAGNDGIGKGGALFICDYGTGTGQISHSSADPSNPINNGGCSAIVSANSCGVAFSGNNASDALTTQTDNADWFGNFPAGAANPCPSPVSPATLPIAPSGLNLMVISQDQIAISWRDNSDNEDRFIVERYDPGRGWVQVGAAGSDAVSFTDTVPYKWLFQYRVAACNAAGCAYSEVVAVKYWAPWDPHVPYNILVTDTMYAFGESITVPENLDPGTFIGVISSSDDTPGGDPQTYSLWSPPDGPSFCNDWFYIRWKLLFLKKPFDYETKPEICVINIQARDTHGNFRTDHIVVNVADEDESPWNIRLSRNTVYENQPAGTEVGKFSTADDEDDTEHSYYFTEGEEETWNSFFVIEGNVLKTKSLLDYETGNAMTVQVTSWAISDGHSVTKHFVIEVLNAPDAPAVSKIADQRTDDEIPAAVNFTVSDQDTAAKYLTVSGKSDSQDVLPDANISFSGSGENRTVTLTPVPGKTGTANITVFVSDGSQRVSTEFKLTVTAGPNIKSEIRTDAGTVAPGGILSFTAVISNTGDRAAENVTFAVPIPENTEYVSGTASAGTYLRQSRGVSYRAETNQAEWTGDIPAGETAEITLEVRINADAKRGSSVVISQGTVSYDEGQASAASAASGEMLVTVEGCMAGDADGNGLLEIRDALISLQAATGIIPEAVCPDADVSGDGKIGTEEAVYLLNNL